MVTYRNVERADLENAAFRALICRGVKRHELGVEIDEAKLWSFCRALAEFPSHFFALAEEEGRFVGYIGALTATHPWLDGVQLNVIGWYSERPFAGMRLLMKCLAWARAIPALRLVAVSFDKPSHQLCAILRRRAYVVNEIPACVITV